MFEFILFYSRWADVLSKVWVLMILCALAVVILPPLNDIANHGKVRKDSKEDERKPAFLLVPKKFFTHFYILSTVLITLAILIDLSSAHFYLTKYLFLFHSVRRLLECQYITNYSNSLMHIGGYLCGLAHYLFAVLSLEISSIERTHLKSPSYKTIGWIGIILFFVMNYLQFQSHYILYKNKNKKLKDLSQGTDDKRIYSLPSEGLFRFCCCPHYFAEIGIYFSLFLMENHCITILLMFLWVFVNLSIVAYKQFLFYLENDFDRLESGRVKILFPFLW
jgi:3-oxo-5-alpha-steroid 4-dehydrogenase 3